MSMRLRWVTISMLLLIACGDKVVPVSASVSPDGNVTALYKLHLFGGAAGGTGHCISIVPRVGKEHGCALLGASVCITKIYWRENELIVEYHGGEFTRVTRKVSFTGAAGGIVDYNLSVNEVHTYGPCLTENLPPAE